MTSRAETAATRTRRPRPSSGDGPTLLTHGDLGTRGGSIPPARVRPRASDVLARRGRTRSRLHDRAARTDVARARARRTRRASMKRRVRRSCPNAATRPSSDGVIDARSTALWTSDATRNATKRLENSRARYSRLTFPSDAAARRRITRRARGERVGPLPKATPPPPPPPREEYVARMGNPSGKKGVGAGGDARAARRTRTHAR